MNIADPASGAGAGVAAARTAAVAAELLQKVTQDELAGRLRERALDLAAESEVAFGDARAELARAGEGGRDDAIADAMDRATAAPLAIAATATDIAALAREAAGNADPMLRAEAVAAVFLADAVTATCAHLVQINLINAGFDAVQSEARRYAETTAAHRAALQNAQE